MDKTNQVKTTPVRTDSTTFVNDNGFDDTLVDASEQTRRPDWRMGATAGRKVGSSTGIAVGMRGYDASVVSDASSFGMAFATRAFCDNRLIVGTDCVRM